MPEYQQPSREKTQAMELVMMAALEYKKVSGSWGYDSTIEEWDEINQKWKAVLTAIDVWSKLN